MTEWELLVDGARQYGIEMTETMLSRFQRLYQLLLEGNQKANLTRIIEPRDVVVKHFLDSLSLFAVVPPEGEKRIVDIGAGAGFPALPILLACPGWKGTLVESVKKKTAFMQEAIADLGLSAEALPERAEDLGRREGYRDAFDLAVARAVADLGVLTELCLPLVKVGGKFIALKGPTMEDELKDARHAIYLLGGKLEKVVTIELPEEAGSRTLVVIEKLRPTPKAYPRPAGVPQKKKLR